MLVEQEESVFEYWHNIHFDPLHNLFYRRLSCIPSENISIAFKTIPKFKMKERKHYKIAANSSNPLPTEARSNIIRYRINLNHPLVEQNKGL